MAVLLSDEEIARRKKEVYETLIGGADIEEVTENMESKKFPERKVVLARF